ncbi:MAG: hypothetical protein K6C36_07045 [Clostridia bacterium]|nr:hypothetical protein [Clostridia bacterium]
MNVYNDSDMKIVGAPVKNEPSVDETVLLRRMHEQTFNGNIRKAGALGTQIVSAFSYSGASSAPQDVLEKAAAYTVPVDDELIFQLKLLTFFTAEYCVERYLPHSSLGSVATTKIYDILREGYPEFYRRISDFVAVSFYCVGVAADGDTAENVGTQFAMLCGHGGEKNYIDLGADIFRLYRGRFKKAIAGFGFVQ